MARGQVLADQHRRGGQRDRPLRHPVPGMRRHLLAQRGQGALVRVRADDDPAAARAVHGLQHELVEPAQHPVQHPGVAEPVGLHVAQQRLLAQVVADQVGHVGVEQLVVRYPVADRVRDRDLARAGRVEQARAADDRIGPELQRVEELVVDAAVDHVHRLAALRGVHVHAVAGAGQVASLDQFHAHQPGQQGVLKIGGVVHAGGEQDHDRVGRLRRRRGAQRGQQPGRVLVDGMDVLLGEQGRERPGHGQPVLHHVADAGRGAQIVFQHPELALLVPDQVDARDVHPHAVGRVQARGLPAEVLGREHQPPRQHAVGEDLARPVHVGEEGLQGQHPLAHPQRDVVPLDRVDDPRDQVQRERALLARVVKGHAPVGEAPGHLVGPVPQFARVQRLQRGEHGLIGRARLAGPLEHLVPGGG